MKRTLKQLWPYDFVASSSIAALVFVIVVIALGWMPQ